MNKIVSLIEGWLQRSTILTLLALTLIAGTLTGLILAYQVGFTTYAAEVEALSEYQPGEITKVYADDGKTIIGELALERRVPLTYEQIPEKMKQSILAIEDTRFREHMGVDFWRLGGAILKNVVSFSRKEGASTLTQQVSRMLYLKTEKTWTRKFRELIYTLQIERYYTKDQIMTMYCNMINLGGGAYGVEAAANYYFSKSINDLSVEEYALLAAIPKSPTNYNPTRNPKAATTRRNLVLEAMAENGFISQSECDAAKARPIKLNLDEARKNDRGPYAYVIEDIRQELSKLAAERGAQDAMNIYRAGLSIYTTIDAEGQKQATDAVRKQLRRYDRRRGWRGGLPNVIESENADLEEYRHETWTSTTPEKGEFMLGLIKNVSPQGADVTFGLYNAHVTQKETQWTNKPPSVLFKKGDLAYFSVNDVDREKKTVTVELEQSPEIQAAIAVIDAKTGEVKVEVGGYDFSMGKFNHATQAMRQTGSAFKPFIYAAAIEDGLKPEDNVSDTPFTRGGWTPHNYDNTYKGTIPIKTALALSRNIPAVRILDEVGINKAVNMVKRFGLPNPMAPFLPSALGATEEPLLAMVSAYTAFPNKGVRIEPYRVRKVVDREGHVVFEAEPKEYRVMHEYVAGTMVQLMRGVVTSGTAKSVSGLQGHEIAGKTGTVNDFTDAWFIGYTPRYVCGNWIGYSDSKKTLGHGESGTSAALPFWADFMRQFLANKPRESFYKTPEAPKEIKDRQKERDRDRFSDQPRLVAKKGDSLPISRSSGDSIPNIDPLATKVSDAPPPLPDKPTPTPPIMAATPPPTPKPEAPRPRIANPEPKPEVETKKGKKGKIDDPPN
ncbi:MAG TPA: PBP1A family penicillin-binding protein [Blastocatellia bacterium]|nr:PBP1A family penicillin-binding protein [Blastocatellia bacterium]